MLVEVQYADHNGSVCPFCGLPAAYEQTSEDWEREGYKVKLYPCSCPMGHLFFVAVETTITDDDYLFLTRAFVHYQDWEEHIDMTITAGAYVIPHLDDEDDAWVIHLELLEKANESKEHSNRA